MKRLLVILFSYFIFLQGIITAQSFDDHYTFLQNDASGFIIETNFSTPQFYTVSTEQGDHIAINVPGFTKGVHIGAPDLPTFNRLIEIPFGAEAVVDVEILEEHAFTLDKYGKNIHLMPAQPSVSKSDTVPLVFQKNYQIYNDTGWYSLPIARVEELGIMRNVSLGRLEISPFRYHPSTGAVTYISRLKINVRFNGNNTEQGAYLKQSTFTPSYDPSLYTINREVFSGQYSAVYPEKYIILADSMFQQVLQPFIAWKQEKGYHVIEVYKGAAGVGTTASSMKAYIQSIYNAATPTDPAAVYLLIVGDIAQIPAFTGTTGNYPTDLYYVEFTGDIFPEMQYGRFSATSVAELIPQINKTIDYEQCRFPDLSWLANSLLVAGHDATHSSTYANGQMYYAENEYSNNSNGINPNVYLYPASSSMAAQIRQDANNGTGFINYSAHGSATGWDNPSYSVMHINNMTNVDKYPFVITNACNTGNFSYNTCFSEAWLRKPDGGAIGHIGATTLSNWDEDYYWAVGVGSITATPSYNNSGNGFYDLWFHTHGEPFSSWARSQCQIMYAGNMAVTQAATNVTLYWEMYHLMGDPSLMPHFNTPVNLTATYPQVIVSNVPVFSLQTEPYAYVALSAQGMLHGAGYADALGNISLSITPFSSADTALLVITAQGRIPIIDTIPVILPTGPYLVLESVFIDDATGDNDNRIDYNEQVALDVTIKNYTSFPASNATATLFLNDPFLIVTDSTDQWSNIGANTAVTNIASFALTATGPVPDQHIVSGIIEIASGTQQWFYPVSFTIEAPTFVMKELRIIDSIAGNGNGTIDPGETIAIELLIKNEGSSPASQITIDLAAFNSFFSITKSQDTINIFEPGLSYTVKFTGSVSANTAAIGSFIKLLIHFTATPYLDTIERFLMIGDLVEDFESNGFFTFPWVNDTNQPWIITTESYEGQYAAKSDSIAHNTATSMEVTMPVLTADTIRFAYKVSSEAYFDFLKFFIDNNIKKQWSGEMTQWELAAFPVDTGMHTFRWSYVKDYSMSEGSDCAWIDYIIFPPSSIFSSIESIIATPDITVFPNPAEDAVNIRFNNNITGNYSLYLLNSSGKIISKHQYTNANHVITLPVASLSPGIYFLRIQITGFQPVTHKIIKF